MVLDNLKQYTEIYPNEKDITPELFIYLHAAVEGYFKRLLFIGIRINEVQYKIAQDVLAMLTLQKNQCWDNAIALLNIKNLFNNSECFREIYTLFNNFSSRYRNWFVHGINENLPPEILKMCVEVDITLIKVIEGILKANGKPSAFQTPTEWGARVVMVEEEPEEVINRLGLGNVGNLPLIEEEAKQKFNRVKELIKKEGI